MSLYMGRGKLSQEAIKAYLAKPEDRTAMIKGLYEATGLKLLHVWATPAFDLISIAEGDPMRNAVHNGVALAGGAVTEVSWTELLTLEQLAVVMKDAAVAAGKYRAPGK